MQVQYKITNENAETQCSVCGLGLEMYWERQSRLERAEMLIEVHRVLRNHHRSQKGTDAHPSVGFYIPERNSPNVPSGVAFLGQAPTWAL
jgi:hypothetical protein